MQLTRILYSLLMKHAVGAFCVGFLVLNSFLFNLAEDAIHDQAKAQKEYIKQFISTSIPLELVKPLNENILEWRFYGDISTDQKRRRFSKSWSEAESEFTLKNGKLKITHRAPLSAYFFDFIAANLTMIFSYILIMVLSHYFIYKHWKVLIQLEEWAYRFERNKKFKFFIKTRKYHLVNTFRDLNQARVEAQKGGQKADHFIRSQTFLDANTGLGNRLYFEHRLDSVLQQDDKVYGAVLIIDYEALELVRDREGKGAEKDLLLQFSEILKEYVDDTAQSVVSRISSNEFAILLPFVDGTEVERISKNILRMSQKVKVPDYVDVSTVCHIGADMYDRENTSFQILAEADMALRAAQLNGPSDWFMYDSGELPPSEIKGSVRWRTAIQNAIDNNSFVLFYQPVIDDSMHIHHHEVLVRMSDGRGELISAKVFLPMAKKCGLIPDIDRQILQGIAEKMTNQAFSPVSINIHIDSWLNRDFCNWLLQFLKKYREYAHYFIFEVSEFELAHRAKRLASIFAAVKRYHVQIMVDQVGLYVLETSYLDHVQVDYLKLHQSIVNNIHEKPENQMFIRSLQSAITNKELLVFAMGVESELEIIILKRLGITGVQGHYIKRPTEKLLAAKEPVSIDGDNLDL